MTTAQNKGRKCIFASNFLLFRSKLLFIQGMRNVTFMHKHKLQGNVFLNAVSLSTTQASTDPTELVGKSAASCRTRVWPVLVNPVTQISSVKSQHKAGSSGHHKADGGRRPYFISFLKLLKTLSCLLPSAFIPFSSVLPTVHSDFHSISHLFLCCHLSILSHPRLQPSHLTIAFWISTNSRAKGQRRKREGHGKMLNIAAAVVYNSVLWLPWASSIYGHQGVTAKCNPRLWGWEKQVPQKTC